MAVLGSGYGSRPAHVPQLVGKKKRPRLTAAPSIPVQPSVSAAARAVAAPQVKAATQQRQQAAQQRQIAAQKKALKLVQRRREWRKWSETSEEKRPPIPKIGGNVFLHDWLNKHDPEYKYIEDGGRMTKEAYRREYGGKTRGPQPELTGFLRLQDLPRTKAERLQQANLSPRVQARAEARANKLWVKAKRSSGVRGRRPPVHLNAPEREGAAAYAAFGEAYLPPEATRMLGTKGPEGRAGKPLLLHEYAHTQQQPDETRNEQEGLADLYARLVAKRLGVGSQDLDYTQGSGYAPYRRRVRRRYDNPFILREQFR